MKCLLVDIGAGTMDILCCDTASGRHYKAVVKSPVLTTAEAVASISRDLVITGYEMGGGAVSGAIRKAARESDVAMTASAAATLAHDPAGFGEWGIRIVDENTAADLATNPRYGHVFLSDLQIERIAQLIGGFGIPFVFDVAAVCAQDHGIPPSGVSHLDYRHGLFKERLDADPFPDALLFSKAELPSTFGRLSAIAEAAEKLPAREVYVMDSGMAAILGASLDSQAAGSECILVLDVATSHTVAAVIAEGALAGFFEYHTRDITRDRLKSLIPELANGTLSHEAILAEGGHGAYIRKAVGADRIGAIIATGPKRGLVRGSGLPVVYGAPMGDNMMTGTAGLLEALRRRKHLPPIDII